MEVQLQELLTKIQDDGVKEAERKANIIIKEAENKASDIIKKAKKQASVLIQDAEKKTASFEASSIQAVTQAGRNLILQLKSKISEIFNTVIQNEVQSILQSNILEDIIASLIKAWVEKGVTDIEILLSPDDASKIKDHLLSRLNEKMKKGITIKPIPGIKSGFRIMEKDGTSYFNLTDSGIAECLAEYLNPKLASILDVKEDRGSSN